MQTDLSSRPTTRPALSSRAAFALLATLPVTFLGASAAPTPLYGTYAAEWGFSAMTTTVIFGVYAVAVLVSLLVLGRLSDHVGRRPVLLVSVAVQLVATAAFLLADGVTGLVIARIVQGVATGAASGAIAAALIDVDPRRGVLANTIVTPAGTGLGAIGAGLVVQFLPAPTHLVYVLLLVIFAVQFVGVLFMRETVAPVAGAVRSLRPEIALPARARRAVVVATPALVAAWALPSFFASLGPALMRTLSGSDAVLLGGLPLFLVALGAFVATVTLRDSDPTRVMAFGTAGMALGTALSLGAVALDSALLLCLTIPVAGLGFGAAFPGAVRSIVPLARAHERAGLMSVVYVVSYLALGVPAMLGGMLAVHNADVIGTATEYGTGVIVLALLAGVGLLLPRRPVAGRECLAAG